MMYIYNVRNGPYLAFGAPIGPYGRTYLSDDGLEDYPQRKALNILIRWPEDFLYPFITLTFANPVALLLL